MMTEIVSNMIGGGFHWMGQWIVNRLGWGGIVGLVAGGILLISLSARAVKGLTSRRGMAITATVMVIGLTVMWLTWPKAAPAMPLETASVEPEPVATEPVAERIEPAAVDPMASLAVQARRTPPNAFVEFPAMAMPVEPVAVMPMMPTTPVHIPTMPQINHPIPPRPAARAGHATSSVTHAAVLAMPQRPMGQASQNFGGMGNHLTPAQQAHQARNMANQQANMMIQQQLNSMNEMHPIGGMNGGMHPMGGMNPGGVTHGMAHPGGHR